MKLVKYTAIISGLLISTFAGAHHSFQATYDMDSMIEIKGKLVQMNFRNPHSSVMVMAPDKEGTCSVGALNGVAPACS